MTPAATRAGGWRRLLAASALAGVAAVSAACGSAPSAAPAHSHAATLLSSTSKSTTTASSGKATKPLAECGATRDPFDPTDSAAPAGSPARC